MGAVGVVLGLIDHWRVWIIDPQSGRLYFNPARMDLPGTGAWDHRGDYD